PSPALLEQIGRMRPVPTRAPARALLLVLAASVAWGAAVLALRHLRRDLGALPLGWLLGVGAAWAAALAAPPAPPLLPRRRAVQPDAPRALWAAAIAGAAAVGCAFALPSGLAPPGGAGFALAGATCLGLGLLVALLPSLLALFALRGVVM